MKHCTLAILLMGLIFTGCGGSSGGRETLSSSTVDTSLTLAAVPTFQMPGVITSVIPTGTVAKVSGGIYLEDIIE